MLAKGEAAVEERKAEIENLNIVKKENIAVGTVPASTAECNLLDTYLHRQDGRGVVGVMLEGSGVPRELLHEIALHAAFAKPRYLQRDEIPAADIDKERATCSRSRRPRASPRPPGRRSSTVNNAWIADQTLLEQGVHGDKESVAQRIGDGRIVAWRSP